ncbi:MAG: recombinase [Leisingera sp.]
MTSHQTGEDGGTVFKRQVLYTADLLRSLQDSIHRLRNEAEALREQLELNGDDETTGAKGQISKLNDLIRDCQKVGKTIAEQSADFARMLNTEQELDFDAARREVESRLSGIRATLSAGLVSD